MQAQHNTVKCQRERERERVPALLPQVKGHKTHHAKPIHLKKNKNFINFEHVKFNSLKKLQEKEKKKKKEEEEGALKL